MSFRVDLSKTAKKQFAGLDAQVRRQIARALKSIGAEPRHHGIIKLKGSSPPTFRERSGDYRIIFRINDAAKAVHVMEITDRKDAY